MGSDICQRFFGFVSFCSALREIERYKGQFYWRDYPQLSRYESVADHSWRVGLLVLLFEKQLSQKIDTQKALKMALIHDIAEIITGDKSPVGSDGTGRSSHAFDSAIRESKFHEEREAIDEIFSRLPVEIREELMGYWIECEKRESFESKVVKALDKVEAFMFVFETRQGEMFDAHLKFSTDYLLLQTRDSDPAIYEFALYISEKMKSQFKEFVK